MRIVPVLGVLAALALSACATTTPMYYGGGYGGYSLNPSANPTFGAVNLYAGFTPDPYTVSITAGGTIDTSTVLVGCRGAVASAPDYRVRYSAGGYPLTFMASSNSDTTLLINGPNGEWYCDDDSGGGLNPMLRFGSPPSGVYDIWIGTYNGGTASSVLTVTER